MPPRSGSSDRSWIALGTLAFIALLTVLYWLREDGNPNEQLASKAKRVELVHAMRLALAAASEAENSAVMSAAERDSETFVQQARAATEELDRAFAALQEDLTRQKDPHALELLKQVETAIQEFRRVDGELLSVAVQDSNRKAYQLAFGPFTQSIQQLDQALAARAAGTASADATQRLQTVESISQARIGLLRMYAILLPHIAEESNEKMDALESQLAQEERTVADVVKSLSEAENSGGAPPDKPLAALLDAVRALQSQILKLSRENTDVRSVALALNEKRQAMLACQDALVVLEQSIQGQPIVSIVPAHAR